MNKQGQVIGAALLLVVFVFSLVLFTTIDPLKENLDVVRDNSELNCRGTTGFNQTAFDNDEDDSIAKLTRRPTCFVTGLSMVYFIFSFLIAMVTWLARNWVKKRRIVR